MFLRSPAAAFCTSFGPVQGHQGKLRTKRTEWLLAVGFIGMSTPRATLQCTMQSVEQVETPAFLWQNDKAVHWNKVNRWCKRSRVSGRHVGRTRGGITGYNRTPQSPRSTTGGAATMSHPVIYCVPRSNSPVPTVPVTDPQGQWKAQISSYWSQCNALWARSSKNPPLNLSLNRSRVSQVTAGTYSSHYLRATLLN